MSLAEIRGTPLGTKMGIKPLPVTTVVKNVQPKGALMPGKPVQVFAGTKTTGVSMVVTKPSSITPQMTTAQKEAIAQAYNLKFGQAVVSNPANQRMIALLRTKAIVANISSKGLELAPKGSSELLYTAEQQAATFRDALNVLYGQQEEWTGKQAEYLTKISGFESTLAAATQKGAIAQAQLEKTTGKYKTLMEKYNELLNKPPSEGIDPISGLIDFFRQYGLWIILGIGAIIFIPSLIKATRKGD